MNFRYAFFDFDETVFRHKSMFEFAEYYLESIDELNGSERFETLMTEVREMSDDGVPRSEVNRFYYKKFEGHSVDDVQRLSGEWYDHLRSGSESYLIESAANEIEELRRQGTTLALVSGAFEPILRPFAEALGFSTLLCSTAEIVDGHYTGRLVGAPVIGDEKAVRIRAFLEENGIAAEDCCAFGDHPSDLPMLEAVGTATVVNPDAKLSEIAKNRGWAILRG